MRRMGRLWRELRPDHNPLRRACDRAEAVLLAALLAAWDAEWRVVGPQWRSPR